MFPLKLCDEYRPKICSVEGKILSMFELSRNPKFAISVDKHFVECALSQGRSVPTDRQTLSMRRYPRVDTRRKGPGALWVHPLICGQIINEVEMFSNILASEIDGVFCKT